MPSIQTLYWLQTLLTPLEAIVNTNTLYVTALISALLTASPATALANCSLHKTQQAGNETSVGGNKFAGGEGTGVEGQLLTGNETAVGGEKIAKGNETTVGGSKFAVNDPASTGTKLDN